MAGSSLIVTNPRTQRSHTELSDRDQHYQHVLESIYRRSDGKDLATIINEIQTTTKSVKCELIHIIEEGQREVTITQFEYNMARDVLFVTICGQDVYEGTDFDFVKTSPASITFNYDLHEGYEVFIVLAGTISAESFGDDIFNALSQFTQLVDTPNSYYGHGHQYLKVNEEETGLVFSSVKASNDLIKIERELHISENNFFEGWMQFIHIGVIKGIKFMPKNTQSTYDGNLIVDMWEKPNGYWIYSSGSVQNILWDIFDIPHVDVSEQDSVYIKIQNNGPEETFLLQIYVVL